MNSKNAKTIRFVNGLVAAAIACFFLAHSVLGSTSFHVEGLHNSVPWVVWIMLGVVGVHVVLSAVTTASLVTDKERPPSKHKKQHFVLKWVTGVVLLLVVVVHVVGISLSDVMLLNLSPDAAGAGAGAANATGAGTETTGGRPVAVIAAAMVLAAALAWHAFTGAKSLMRDLHLNVDWRDPARGVYVGVICVVVIACIVAIVARL